jgi:uncharacterized protein (TIGR02118 family)
LSGQKEAAVPKLIILYGRPDDPAAFEDYYANRHIPYASEHMPGVTGAENLRITGTGDGGPGEGEPPYYRVSQLSYASMDDLRSGLASAEGNATIADLANFATGGATLLIAED